MLQRSNLLGNPYVTCDQCKRKTLLPGNCIDAYGMKFIRPALKKLGMTYAGPHICKTCRDGENSGQAIGCLSKDGEPGEGGQSLLVSI